MLFKLSMNMKVSVVRIVVCFITSSIANSLACRIFRCMGKWTIMLVCSGPLNTTELTI